MTTSGIDGKELKFMHGGMLGINITKEEFADRIRFMGYSITPKTEFAPSETWIEEASKVTQLDRQVQYGPPLINFLRTAVLWNTFMGNRIKEPFTPQSVCWMMSLLKVGREMQLSKRDNGVDAIGYISLVDAMDRNMQQIGFPLGTYSFVGMTNGEMADFLYKLENNLFTSQD